jgi:hypothetical protein
VNFTTMLASRGSYKPLNLISLQGRIKETTAIWLIVFSFLLAVVFSLEVGANLSRGATATFMIAGMTLLITWRAVLSSYLVDGLARGIDLMEKHVELDLWYINHWSRGLTSRYS